MAKLTIGVQKIANATNALTGLSVTQAITAVRMTSAPSRKGASTQSRPFLTRKH